MRAVLQRVSKAQVDVDGQCVGRVGAGLCALVGVGRGDTARDAQWLADKVVNARIFEDSDGKMNRSVLDTEGSVLAISQFTLLGDLRTGRRPSFSEAMEPEMAKGLFEEFCRVCGERGVEVQTGRFRAEMRVELVNEGPVTLLLDSRKIF